MFQNTFDMKQQTLKICMICFSFLFLDFCQGQVRIQEESGVATMMNDYLSMNRQSSTIKAWRIQIITTPDRRKMEQARGKFAGVYPHLESYWTHENPYYKVKVGAFETKEDLQNFLLELKKDFPSAIPVQDNIEKTELVR